MDGMADGVADGATGEAGGDTIDEALLDRAAELLAAARHTVVLTGAGISQESGIRTFRGKGGLWTERGEPSLNQYQQFAEDPQQWWRERLEREANPEEFQAALGAAAPNAGHLAMVELESLGVIAHVITQNVDDLHRQAGQQSVTEIHGNVHWMRCATCHARWPRAEVVVDPQHLPPRCSQPGCDGVVKGDGVMFGEPIPPYALQRSQQETDQADLFIVAGTTAVVFPAANYPLMAMQRGVPLLEINTEPTVLSDHAEVVLRGPTGQALPALVERVRALRPG